MHRGPLHATHPRPAQPLSLAVSKCLALWPPAAAGGQIEPQEPWLPSTWLCGSTRALQPGRLRQRLREQRERVDLAASDLLSRTRSAEGALLNVAAHTLLRRSSVVRISDTTNNEMPYVRHAWLIIRYRQVIVRRLIWLPPATHAERNSVHTNTWRFQESVRHALVYCRTVWWGGCPWELLRGCLRTPLCEPRGATVTTRRVWI